MADIWSNVGGSDLAPSRSEEWLYRLGSEIRGPVPKQSIVDKLIRGELTIKTMVAREGGDFHPVAEIAAFAEHMDEIKRALRKKSSARTAKVLFLAILVLGAIGGAAGWYLNNQMKAKQAEDARVAEEKRKAAAAQLAAAEDVIKNNKGELVELVSLGDISEMKMGGSEKKAGPRPKLPGGKPSNEPVEMVQSCARSQQEIFGVLGRHLAKINVCVQDEKSRDAANLPSSLTLSFVVRPEGKVSDFEVADRHYRTGPMKNCMTKAFSFIKFDPAGGSNCPVEIPIKIGG
jgi:hypothetical protein